jgi:acyl-CoA thioesterase 8
MPFTGHQPNSPIEQLLGIRRLTNDEEYYESDAFTHTVPLRCPPWARGAYGGHIIALALLSAYETVPLGLRAYSIFCDFFHAADVAAQLVYTVLRTRDTNSFASRRIEAKQLGKVIFVASVSFSLPRRARGRDTLIHSLPCPGLKSLSRPPKEVKVSFATQSAAGQGGIDQPCDCIRVSPDKIPYSVGIPHEAKFYQWIRARGKIMGGIQQQLAALAYMSDNYVIGTTFRAHGATRFINKNRTGSHLQVSREGKEDLNAYYKALEEEELVENADAVSQPHGKQVDWLVTLDHAIYFHDVDDIRADEWMLAEMVSPWAGDERGFVMERIWSQSGILLATCVQQGVIRMRSKPRSERL